MIVIAIVREIYGHVNSYVTGWLGYSGLRVGYTTVGYYTVGLLYKYE